MNYMSDRTLLNMMQVNKFFYLTIPRDQIHKIYQKYKIGGFYRYDIYETFETKRIIKCSDCLRKYSESNCPSCKDYYCYNISNNILWKSDVVSEIKKFLDKMKISSNKKFVSETLQAWFRTLSASFAPTYGFKDIQTTGRCWMSIIEGAHGYSACEPCTLRYSLSQG